MGDFNVLDADIEPLLNLILEEMGRTEGDSKRHLVGLIEDVKEDVRELEQLHHIFGDILETSGCKDTLCKLDEARDKIQGDIKEHSQKVKEKQTENDSMYGDGDNVQLQKQITRGNTDASEETDAQAVDPFTVAKNVSKAKGKLLKSIT